MAWQMALTVCISWLVIKYIENGWLVLPKHICMMMDWYHCSSIGASPGHWDTVIYAGMRNALINALQVTQDDIDYQRNAFELYGADFMITADLKPWLIEINCSPTMSYSTSITKRLCKAVLEDTIKGIVAIQLACDNGLFAVLVFSCCRSEAGQKLWHWKFWIGLQAGLFCFQKLTSHFKLKLCTPSWDLRIW